MWWEPNSSVCFANLMKMNQKNVWPNLALHQIWIFSKKIRILLHSCLTTGTYHKNLEYLDLFFYMVNLGYSFHEKSSLCIFFWAIPTQWQQQQQQKIRCKVYKGFVGKQKRAQIAIFWGKKKQEITRNLDNEFLEVTRTNSDPKNFST